jgi:hypothetical protein
VQQPLHLYNIAHDNHRQHSPVGPLHDGRQHRLRREPANPLPRGSRVGSSTHWRQRSPSRLHMGGPRSDEADCGCVSGSEG